MRIRYEGEADILLVEVRELSSVDAAEEPGGVFVSYGADGEPLRLEFLNASRQSLILPAA